MALAGWSPGLPGVGLAPIQVREAYSVKMLSIVGARPQFVKAAMVSKAAALERFRGQGVREVIVHTGQHFDRNMSHVFFEELEIREPDYNLGVSCTTHGRMTGRMLECLDEVIERERPEWVVVYGDTNSTLAGALAATKWGVPVAHIEAGLRSFNRGMPEEVNRVLTDHASDLLFAPTETAVENLRREGICDKAIVRSGDVMLDAALYYAHREGGSASRLGWLGVQEEGYILATCHRAENTDHPERLGTVLEALDEVAGKRQVVFPLHPRTRAVLRQGIVSEALLERITFIEPVGYRDMLLLEKHASLVVTDSGGVQKEAFFFEVPCITLREETEWTELVRLGWNSLVPPRDKEEVVRTILGAIGNRGTPARPYGDGSSAQQIVERLVAWAPQDRSDRARAVNA